MHGTCSNNSVDVVKISRFKATIEFTSILASGIDMEIAETAARFLEDSGKC